MDSHALLCGGYSLRDGNGHRRDDVQTFGHVECRRSPLYQLALSALGHQAHLESPGRLVQEEALVDCRHAVLRRRGFSRSGFYH